VDVILAVLAANMVVLLASGGYILHLVLFDVRSSTMPRGAAAAAALLAIRFALACIGEGRVGPAFRRGLWRGIGVAAILAVAGLVVWVRFGLAFSSAGFVAAVAAGLVASVVLVSGAYGRTPGGAGAAAVALGLALFGALFMLSPHNGNLWRPYGYFEFSPLSTEELAGGGTSPVGLPDASGLPTTYRTLAGDTRPSILMADGDSFVVRVPSAGERDFTFSVGAGGPVAGGKPSAVKVTVSLAKGVSERTPVAQKTYETTDLGLWNDVQCRVTAPEEGLGVEIAVHAEDGVKVALANPRFPASADERPNIILLVVDALRADHMGLYGYTRPTSLEVDELARSGLVYEKARAVSSWTLPSMASLFTGLFPTSTGVTATERILPTGAATLAERLTGAGYYCAALQTNSLLTSSRGFARGFAEYHEITMKEAATVNRETYERAGAVCQYARDWLNGHSGRPFFLYVHYMDVHNPYEPPPEYKVFGETPQDRYDGAILYTTHEIAGLMSFFEKTGLAEKSLVILTSDHGEQFGEHGDFGHGKSLHAEEMNIPLVVWGPGIERGVCAGLVQNFDLYATLLAAAGVKAGAGLGSLALWGPDGKPAQDLRPECFAEVELRKSGRITLWSVETNGEKLIYDTSNPQPAFYDLTVDPGETKAGPAADAERIVQLDRALLEHIAAVESERERLAPGGGSLRLSDEEVRRIRALGYLN